MWRKIHIKAIDSISVNRFKTEKQGEELFAMTQEEKESDQIQNRETRKRAMFRDLRGERIKLKHWIPQEVHVQNIEETIKAVLRVERKKNNIKTLSP